MRLLYTKSKRVCKLSLISFICMDARLMKRSNESHVAPTAFFLSPHNMDLQILPVSWWR